MTETHLTTSLLNYRFIDRDKFNFRRFIAYFFLLIFSSSGCDHSLQLFNLLSEVRSPLRGLGVGLSLSRWHMRHFGGDLTLERRESETLRVRCDSGRRSKWHVLGKGMTATITIPKMADIPLVVS